MRLLLAIFAVLGLLLTPVAASAGAAYCLGHGGDATMAMSAAPTVAPHTEHKADHSCCDPDGAPAKHDSQACAKACAAMCVATAVLSESAVQTPTPVGRPLVEATPLKAFHAHAPPGLKRPPRTFA
ncbi:MAG: hypothetical protein JHD15_17920 [Phenylobacterium sp.]|uniref:hypothetical protein n=1 Tax=Phenylobacterium sp. TaxID=1871053 RepID=UPI001A32EF39|nr:hypothetical protein [Phenylobacterium sp.]MBJ7412223.1 hypothetical protein [Phenylobacterium sp.]